MFFRLVQSSPPSPWSSSSSHMGLLRFSSTVLRLLLGRSLSPLKLPFSHYLPHGFSPPSFLTPISSELVVPILMPLSVPSKYRKRLFNVFNKKMVSRLCICKLGIVSYYVLSLDLDAYCVGGDYFQCVFWPFSRGSNFSLVSLPPWSYSWPPLAWNPIVPFLPPFEVVPHLLWRRKRKSIVLRLLNSFVLPFWRYAHSHTVFCWCFYSHTLELSLYDVYNWHYRVMKLKNCYFLLYFVPYRSLYFHDHV